MGLVCRDHGGTIDCRYGLKHCSRVISYVLGPYEALNRSQLVPFANIRVLTRFLGLYSAISALFLPEFQPIYP